MDKKQEKKQISTSQRLNLSSTCAEGFLKGR